jgi:hypothetical protein
MLDHPDASSYKCCASRGLPTKQWNYGLLRDYHPNSGTQLKNTRINLIEFNDMPGGTAFVLLPAYNENKTDYEKWNCSYRPPGYSINDVFRQS